MDESGRVDIHNRKAMYARTLQLLKDSDTLEDNKKVILDFIDEYCKDLSDARKLKYVCRLHWFSRMLKKPFLSATREDIKLLEVDIEDKHAEIFSMKKRKWVPFKKRCTETTIADNKLLLRILYKWLEHSYTKNPSKATRTKGYALREILKRRPVPELVIDVVSKVPSPRVYKAKDMLSWMEIVRLSQATKSSRDCAVIQLLGETGLRAAEILTLQRQDLQFKEVDGKHIAIVNIRQSKTVERSIGAVLSVGALLQYIKEMPLKDPEAPLWLEFDDAHHNFDEQHIQSMTYGCLQKVLKGAARRIGLKKKINPHHLRKSAASRLASTRMSTQQLNQYMGWDVCSRAPRHYIFLDAQATNEAYWKSQGVEIKEGKMEIDDRLKPMKCGNCGSLNPAGTGMFCKSCGDILGEKHTDTINMERLIEQAVEKKLQQKGLAASG